MQPLPNTQKKNLLRTAGEIVSQMLNVPILSGLLAAFLYFKLPPGDPNRLGGFLWTVVFLTLVPLCSLFFYIPGKVKDQAVINRRQRVASFVFMIISYPAGYAVLHSIQAPKIYQALALTYTLVTVGLIFFNLLLHYKASGHAAGVAGPVAAMIYLFGLIAAPLLALLPLVSWARVRAKGHNTWQTVVGAILSFTISIGVLWAYGFSPFIGNVH